MKKSIIFVLAFIYSGCICAAMKESLSEFSGLKKINDDLYVGKVNDDFYLVMERIDENNIADWRKYTTIQRQIGERMGLKLLPNTDGSARFEKILTQKENAKGFSKDELWVAYASSKPVTKKASLDTYGKQPRNPSIEMFMTVITHPDAKITSHMGISRTWENAEALEKVPPQAKKQPDQSIHLHSFAAKVMKTRYPEKVYMMTSPVRVMRAILANKMPSNSVFIGDNLYQAEVEKIKNDPSLLLPKFVLKEVQNETPEERKKRLQERVVREYAFYNIDEKSDQLTTNPPRIIRTREGRNQTLTILNPDKTELVTFDNFSLNNARWTYNWIFGENYRDNGIFIPYVLVDLEKLARAKDLVD